MSGALHLRRLFPGTYDLTIELSGFKTAEQIGIVLAPNDTRGIAVRLEIGSESEDVTVRAAQTRGDADRNGRA